MLCLRSFTDADLNLMKKWLAQSHVAKWFTHPDAWLEEITLRNTKYDFITHFIVEAEGQPIGFCQYYDYTRGGESWHGSIPAEGSWSLDYLIGEPGFLGKGNGAALVRLLSQAVWANTGAERIIVQPEPENHRSRNTLRSAGFRYDAENDLFCLERPQKKALSEITLEELWQLFPIFLVPHKAEWAAWYAEAEAALRTALPDEFPCRLSHIGSTAVPGIQAKNIVDILLETEDAARLSEAAAAAERVGFLRMQEEPRRISMNLGYTPYGFARKVYHLHLRIFGDNDELYFRDYLREYPSVRADYEAMKLTLWKQFEHDRDGYTEAKTAFIRANTAIARNLYGNRY